MFHHRVVVCLRSTVTCDDEFTPRVDLTFADIPQSPACLRPGIFSDDSFSRFIVGIKYPQQ